MKAKLCFGIVAGVLLVFSTAPAAWAQKIVNEKGRVVYHFVKTEVMQAGDVPGHIIGIVDASGLVFPDTGEVATFSNKIILDLIKGTGSHQSYSVNTYEDGSTTVSKGKGVTTAHSDGTSTFEGTYTYIGGTGRFAGIKGGGSYTGKRLAPLTQGGPADSFFDLVGTYTLPSQ